MIITAHVHFRDILSGYFLFSRFDWSIFATQLFAKHMKEIIYIKSCYLVFYLANAIYLFLVCERKLLCADTL
jgi:hypothetical protein